MYNGWTYLNLLKDVERARFYGLQALETVETRVEGQFMNLPDLYGLLSGVNDRVENFQKAMEYNQKALQVAREYRGPMSRSVIYAAVNLGEDHLRAREYDKALEYVLLARNTMQKINGGEFDESWHYPNLEVLSRLLRIYLNTEEMDSARVIAFQGLEFLNHVDPSHKLLMSVNMLKGLTSYYEVIEAYDSAALLLTQLDTLYLMNTGPRSIAYALNQKVKAGLHQAQLQSELALEMNAQAFSILGAEWEPDGLTVTEATADLRCQGCEPEMYSQRVALLMDISEQAEPENAMTYYRATARTAELAVEQLDRIKSTILIREGSKQQLFEQYGKIYQQGSMAAWRLYELTQEEKALAQSAWFAEKAKAALLREALFVREVRQESPLPPEILDEERKLVLEIKRFEALLEDAYQAGDSVAVSHLSQDSIFEARERFEEFTVRLRKAYPLHAQTQSESSIASLEDIQSSLQTGECMISFLQHEDLDMLQAMVISTETVRVHLLPWAEEDEELLDQYLRSLPKVSLVQTRRRNRFIDQSHQLYQQLMEPIMSSVPAKRLFGFLLYGSKLVFFTSVGVSFPQNTPDATAMRHP